ncbi:hypothetical protein D3C76_1175870 [compost metagenome]
MQLLFLCQLSDEQGKTASLDDQQVVRLPLNLLGDLADNIQHSKLQQRHIFLRILLVGGEIVLNMHQNHFCAA